MACNCKKSGGGHMAPAPKPQDTSKVVTKPQGEVKKKDEK